MAQVADHLSMDDLERGVRSARDLTAARHFARLAELDTTGARRCLAVDADRDILKAHTGFHWWPKPTKPS